MCLWLLTACLGLLPGNPTQQNIVVVQGVPPPILIPTAAPTTAAATTVKPVDFTSIPPTAAPTQPPTAAPTQPPTAAPTQPPTAAPTQPPTAAPTQPASPTAGGVILAVVLCNNPDIVCVSNPDENATGPLPIDPRLGTTPASSAPVKVLPISGYSAQIPSYDSAVKFPRQRRSVVKEEMNINEFFYNVLYGDSVKHERRKRQSCSCITASVCPPGGANAAVGMIDIRIVTPGGGGGVGQCPTGQVYCCTTGSPIACGTLQTVPATAVAPAAGQATFGEFPWQAIILTKQNDYIAGGVLIDQLNVITVTHRLITYVVSGTAPNVKVRLGEWDAAGTSEPVPFQEFNVAKVFSHPSYNPNTLQFDVTVLRLATAVPINPAANAAVTINRACLPPSPTAAYTGQKCWVAGWGKDMFGTQGKYQQILKKVDVPIVAPATCQAQLQTARLGPTYALDINSFICAGGVASKDSCTGDGGSGLVCQVNGQWVVVGLVAWGLGCAAVNVPAVYVNVATLLPWIQQQVAAA